MRIKVPDSKYSGFQSSLSSVDTSYSYSSLGPSLHQASVPYSDLMSSSQHQVQENEITMENTTLRSALSGLSEQDVELSINVLAERRNISDRQQPPQPIPNIIKNNPSIPI
ncbi:hypothetical protein GcM3_205033 [Golovinomyces cichoracearum]|uniref:Uncharacterized protein n=1 Tax=Golovinomyces cichoracearum TaxID=62708 RepID=A0A420HC38_9PEZI|nr:hypothetical protein GcM3_205033 [Golovinomyces cichoracearum]